MPSIHSRFALRPVALAALWAVSVHAALAQTAPPASNPPTEVASTSSTQPQAELAPVTVKAERTPGVTPGKLSSSTKGDARLLETPQSITVLTRELMDSRQDKSLVEALGSVAGVVAGERGRRGFDDFGIRGQTFGQEKYVDGLNTVRSGYIPAEEIFGAERIEIIKGSASLLFGQVQPGGLVNIVSKRPKPEAFGEFGVTVGNLGQREVTADFGRPLSEGGRSAFRVAALVNQSDDATDVIYFKNRYLAPSLTLDLGSATDFTLLTSFQQREWLRNQGLAPKGTVLPNPNGPIERSLYIGEPTFGHNDARRTRVGYALEHRFASGWKLNQNFRWDDAEMNQRPSAFYGALGGDNRTQSRTASVANDQTRALALDTYASYRLPSSLGSHDLTMGVDLSDKYGRLTSRSCTPPPIDLYKPVYGVAVPCAASQSDTTLETRGLGLYARDRLKLGERLHLSFGARHDRVDTTSTNNVSGKKTDPSDAATTGMAGLVFEVLPGIAPYASLANSFVPLTGVDRNGALFQPETGRQAEVGVKFERDGGRQIASVALYDLRRANVLTTDPVNAAFSVQQGEHHSKGLELELAAELRNGWNLTAAYAYTDAVVSKSNKASELGRIVNNVPKHSASAWGMYRVHDGALAGWSAGLGLRKVSERTGYSYDFTIPGYTVFDAALHYQGRGFRVALNLKNLADKTIYGGALSNSVVTLGDTRQARLSVVYEL